MAERKFFSSLIGVLATGIFIAAVGGVVLCAIIPRMIKPRGDTPQCVRNLVQLENAKEAWVQEHHAKTNDVVIGDDLKEYLVLDSNKNIREKCPQGGTYLIGKVGEPVRCSLGTNVTHAHVLP
jgi:hypothetical protein